MDIQSFYNDLLKYNVAHPSEAKDILIQLIHHHYSILLPNTTRLATLTKYILKYNGRANEFNLKLKQRIELWEYGRVLSNQERPMKGQYIVPKTFKNEFIADCFHMFRSTDMPADYYVYVTRCSFILTARNYPDPIMRFQYPIRDERNKWRFRFYLDFMHDIRIFKNCLPKEIERCLWRYKVRRFHGRCYIEYVTLHQCKLILKSLKRHKIRYYAHQNVD